MGADWYAPQLFVGIELISDCRSYKELKKRTKALIQRMKEIETYLKVKDYTNEVHSRMEGLGDEDYCDMINIGIGFTLSNVSTDSIQAAVYKVNAFLEKHGDDTIRGPVIVKLCMSGATHIVSRLEEEIYYGEEEE
jgi:hypothetical protein